LPFEGRQVMPAAAIRRWTTRRSGLRSPKQDFTPASAMTAVGETPWVLEPEVPRSVHVVSSLQTTQADAGRCANHDDKEDTTMSDAKSTFDVGQCVRVYPDTDIEQQGIIVEDFGHTVGEGRRHRKPPHRRAGSAVGP
jgi:hypothetical protein